MPWNKYVSKGPKCCQAEAFCARLNYDFFTYPQRVVRCIAKGPIYNEIPCPDVPFAMQPTVFASMERFHSVFYFKCDRSKSFGQPKTFWAFDFKSAYLERGRYVHARACACAVRMAAFSEDTWSLLKRNLILLYMWLLLLAIRPVAYDNLLAMRFSNAGHTLSMRVAYAWSSY